MRWKAKGHGRGTARAMLLTSVSFKEKFPDTQFYSDYAKLALSTRRGWSKTGETTFRHDSGRIIEIHPDDSLREVVKLIVETEIRNVVSGRPDEETLVQLAITGVEEYYSHK